MIEVVFLVALAVSVTVAELRPLVIAGVMALGWLLAAGIEWAAWRDQPHYGSGLPPRWYVPRVDLPPARPLESVVAGYPAGRRDEAPTWIAPAELREQVLGDWPLAAPIAEPERDPDEEVAEEAWTVVELPPEPAEVAEPPAAAPASPVAPSRPAEAVARYSLDPLAEDTKRRFGRAESSSPSILVPARPERRRVLPGRAEREP